MPHHPAVNVYTRALFDQARAEHLEVVLADLLTLRGLLQTSPEFAGFVADPTLPDARQEAILRALFEGKLADLTLRFLILLANKERIDLLPDIIGAFEALVNELRGILAVEVVAAHPLRPDQLAALCQKLEARTGKTVRATVKVDESLLGGFLVRIGDRIEDLSVINKLKQFQQNVTKA